MEAALYHPEHGYYERGTSQVGRAGDFITSVSVGSVFGEMLAMRFADWLLQLGHSGDAKNEKTYLIEAGAHDGQLALDILRWLKKHKNTPAMTYLIIEPSARRRDIQRRKLSQFADIVKWVDHFTETRERFGPIRGVIFSNELFDAIPARRVGWNAARRHWFEWGVDWRDNAFQWTELQIPIIRPSEFDLPLSDTLLDVLPDRFTTEINHAATDWWQNAAAALAVGWLMTIDYGLAAEDFFSPARPNGTLRAYREHRLSDNPLASPGEQDLTAHVNWTAIQRAGESRGLVTEWFGPQGTFLTAVLEEQLRRQPALAKWSQDAARQIQTLVHPEHFGRKFQVLAQRRS